MANYYGSGRSNYVTVKDKEKFKDLCNLYELDYWEESDKVGFGTIGDYGEFRTEIFNDETGEIKPLPDPMDSFAELLEDQEVLIFMHVGNEKLRYLNGYAIAINNKKEYKQVSLYDIYEIAKFHLGKKVTTCTY